jgi:methylmalonyl-CoA mutase
VFVECDENGLANLAMLISAVREQGLATARLRGAIASDPLNSLIQRGHLVMPMSEVLDHMAVMTAWGIEIAPSMGSIWVHGDTHHNAGATAVEELAAVIATALYYVREMESRSLVPETVLPRMRFSFGAGTSFFMEIAKLRAARLLWQRLLEAANVDPDDRRMWMHVRTSRTGLSHLDAHTNLLRLTTGALAAAVAGADSIEVDPFDIPDSTPSEFSRRLARNTQVILADEVHLDTVTDPAGGCWYVEWLTHELARRGWEQFQQIESKGGMLEAVRSGWWQEQIASVVKERRSRFAHRKEVLVGANKYPAPPAESETPARTAQSTGKNAAGRQDSEDDAVAKVLEELKQTDVSDTEFVEVAITAATAGASSTAINNAVRQGTNDPEQAPKVAPFRAAEPFEAIHSAVRNAAKTQPNLKAFVVGLGPVRNYMPRVDFAAGFLEVGGFEVARNLGFDTPEEAVKAFGESGCAIALVCGTDENYAEDAVNAAQMIRSSSSDALIVLAGLPGDDLRKELERAGVEFFIHLGSDVPMTLSAVARRLGVAL